MSAQETSARTRSRRTGDVLRAFALAAAVLVVASQASSLRSTTIGPQVPLVPAQTALTANPDLRTSSQISKGCWRRKFGCGQDATTTANPDRRTSSHISKRCWRRKFGCGHGEAAIAPRGGLGPR
jgi:hypothetical protein